MKLSNNYIFYPGNNELVKAIEYYKGLLADKGIIDDAPDNSIAVQDNFLYTRGNFEQQRFNTSILEPAREAFESILSEMSRQQSPLNWAAIQNSLGNILAALGQQRMDVALYEKAITAFNLALEEFKQQDSPLNWATAQYNLGTAAQALGRQQDDSKLLKISIDAYTNTLLEWTQDQAPELWATTMFQLGTSFYAHGKLLKGNRTFQKSVVAFKNALVRFDADNYALALSATHNSRGVVLQHLAESEENSARMEEAIRSYEIALLVAQEQQLPIHLAVMIKVNIATARGVLAELTNDSAIAEESADDFELILELFSSVLQPLCLKHCEAQLIRMTSLLNTAA
ncbi:MAG: tetratricopeptide repeat protein [Gammaproteobacteria bacterium]|nr:tetratricopeptide repeat protein [Gammaproteobacteria bacterium]